MILAMMRLVFDYDHPAKDLQGLARAGRTER